MKRWVFIGAMAAALMTLQMEGHAQGVIEVGKKIFMKMMEPNRKLDSAYVFQPHRGWNFSTNYQGGFDHASLVIPLQIDYPNVSTEATLRVNMVNSQSHRLGLRGGYGPISLGFSVAVGPKPDRDFSFNWISDRFGVLFQYTKLHDTATSSLEYPDSAPFFLPEEPSLSHFWTVSGYYAFNHKKFAYSSAYQGKVIQKKSAGSFMIGAKFQHANLRLEQPKSIVGSLMLSMTGYRTYQFSLGAGYSYNWVMYHRDALSSKDYRNLRNLTFNATAIPLLTFVNEMRMTHVIPPNAKEEILPVRGGIRPNALMRLGLCYTFGHFYINSHLDFHYHYFHSRELTEKDLQNALPSDIDYTYRFSVYGHLFNWNAGLELHYRF